jgi:maltose-binding protein MalE
MTPYVKSRQDEFIPSTLATITYQDKQWGVPHKTNAGFLYYRTDQVDKAPATWQEVYDVAAKQDGIAYEDAAVKKAQPFSDELKNAVERAKSRPVSPVSTQISAAIYKNVNKALSGNVSPEEALKKAQSDMEKALKTF